jgi:ubiquitin-conjugating enzyme E2 O
MQLCLSLLGTWSGEKTEVCCLLALLRSIPEAPQSWNPSRSSVFQVLVSIQGLVLVKEPYDAFAQSAGAQTDARPSYYLEPGFEKQRDTPDGARASALYAERTWVLARAFIRRAIERPPAGLAGAIRHLYFPPGRDRLRAVVAHIQRALATVDAPAPPAPDATTATAPETNGDVEARWPESLTKGSAIPLRRTLTALEAALAKGPPDLPEGEEV